MIPITLNVKTFAPALLAKAGLRSIFHLMITAVVGKSEAKAKLPTDIVFVIDGSGSTGFAIPGTYDVRMDKIKEAGQLALDRLEPQDRVAIVRFTDDGEILLPLTSCDGPGKTRAGNALWAIRIGGGTAFSTGLEAAYNLLKEPSPGRNRVVLFLTDGANEGERVGADPRVQCRTLKDAGVTLFIGGLGVENQWENYLQDMAKENSVETNFRGLSTSQDILGFFADVQAAAASTVIRNAKLKLTPVTYAQVQNFEFVTRAKKPNFVLADKSGLLVPVGDIGAEEPLDFYLNMMVVLPEDIAPGRRSFGKIEFIGEEIGTGSETVLRTGNIVVPFVAQLDPDAQGDPEVAEMMGLAAQARELYKAGQEQDNAKAAEHIRKAVEQGRKTRPFSRQEAAAEMARKAKEIQAKIASDPDAAKKDATRATRGFSAAERAAELARMRKNP